MQCKKIRIGLKSRVFTNWELTFWRGNPAVTNQIISKRKLIFVIGLPVSEVCRLPDNDLNHPIFTNHLISNGQGDMVAVDNSTVSV